MIVCIDSGNSRVKWGVHGDGRWQAQGAVAQSDTMDLSALLRDWPDPARVLLANVAGAAAAERIGRQLSPWRHRLGEVRSEARRCGVTNCYTLPSQLGVDRWCALIGAWHRVRSAAIVVMAGTATTIDTLDGDGNFCGGLILPGIDLMQAALARGTAGLPQARGRYRLPAQCTDDAIFSGAIEAHVGAIQRAMQQLDDPAAVCLISGGQAAAIAPPLGVSALRVDNLPLEGLLQIAREKPAGLE